MSSSVLAYGKKVFSFALTFNCLLSAVSAAGILAGFYASHGYWKPFSPFLIEGSLFWVIILTAAINLYPTIKLGQVHVRRLLFHHYVYGFATLAISIILLLWFTSVSVLGLFTSYITGMNVNVGRFFVLGGLTLVLDDFSDVSKKTRGLLIMARSKICRNSQTMHWFHVATGILTLYVSLCTILYLAQNLNQINLPNLILSGTLLLTAITAFEAASHRTWFNVLSR